MNYFYLNTVNALLRGISFEVFKNCRMALLGNASDPVQPVANDNIPQAGSRDEHNNNVLEEAQRAVDYATVSAFVSPTGYTFSKEFERILENEIQREKKYMVHSDITEEQWRFLAEWISKMASHLYVSEHEEAVAMHLVDKFVMTAEEESSQDILLIAGACLLIATALGSDDGALLQIADCSDRSVSAFREKRGEILKCIGGSLNAPNAYGILILFNNHVFRHVLSAPEIFVLQQLQNQLLKKVYADVKLAHIRPSSIAFSLIIVILALIDPTGERNCNFADITFLAAKMSQSTEEILLCLIKFTAILDHSKDLF